MAYTYRFRSLLTSAGLVGGLCLLPVPGSSGDSYFSRVRIGVDVLPAEAAQANAREIVQATSTTAVFDVSVSIKANPQGDNDASVDAGTSDDEQNAYETILGHFADSVCEQTNGVHKIGKVTVFRNFAQKGNVDIVWDDTGRPGAHTTGFGKPGWQIFMYDNFGSIKVSDGGDDLQRLGYITGHEWGHYALGVYDEYREAGRITGTRPSQPLDGDVPTDKAIMNSGRTAVTTGDFSWLNHSTSNNIDVANTAQGRVYGKSGWDTLIQTTNNDPTSIGNWNKPTRTHYSNLVGAEPTAADNWFKLQLSNANHTCRSALDIRWVDALELDIVLDGSGSMAGTRIVNAQTAASTLVDLLPEGTSAAGVSSFASTVQSRAAIVPVTGPADKTALKNAIAAIPASGSTAMFDGAVFGLSKLQTYATTNNTSASQLVFLLSDGGDNASSQTLQSASQQFVAAGVPVIAFGYGSSFDQNMPSLAANTGGRFYQSPTSLTDIQTAFAQAFADASGSAALASSSVSASQGTVSTETFVIDDSVESISLVFSYTGATTDFTLDVQDSAGVSTGDAFTCTAASGSTSCSLELDATRVAALGTGAYSVVATNTTAQDIVYGFNAVAATIPGSANYTVKVASQGGADVAYPKPIVISTVVSRSLPITGMTVQATVTDPSGNVTTVDLNDDGVGADEFADDGLYSAWGTYSSNGSHDIRVTVTNENGTAAYTDGALTQAHYFGGAAPEPGETISLPTLPSDNFQRFGSAQVVVSGVQFDDHSNNPQFGGCTAMAADNAPIDGRIDYADDADCFIINGPISNTSDITVRTFNNALDAEPKYTLYQSDGTTVIATVDPATATPSDGALYTTVAAASIDTNGMILLVSDSDTTHSGGTYSASAGPTLVSDVPSTQTGVPGGGGSSGGGGATGPAGLMVLALLALIGIRRRRSAHLRA